MSTHFIVSPMTQRISLKAGETYKGFIKVGSPKSATEDFRFKISLSPYSMTDNDTSDFSTMSDWSRIVEWITLDTEEGILKPNETKEVHFTIKVPEDAPGGGQYAVLNVSSNETIKETGGGAIQDVFEIGSIIYADIEGDTKHEGDIVGNSVAGFVAVGSPSTTVTVSNSGNVHEVLTTSISIKNLVTGQEILPTESEDGNYENIIMPATTRTVSRELNNIPALGIFEVKQHISYLGHTSDVSTVMVVCPIWFIALIIATIMSIIGMVFYGKRLKRKHKDENKDETE